MEKIYTYEEFLHEKMLFPLKPTPDTKLESEKEVENFLDVMEIKNYKIDPKTLKVTVNGNVKIQFKKLEFLPVNFESVSGNFDITGNELISLDGCPDVVGGNFNCSGNNIKFLKNGPKSVKGDYNCSHNELISIEGVGTIGKSFNCEYNRIVTLKEGPIKIEKGDYLCGYNQLINLEGAPFEVNGNFECKGNRINNIEPTSLKKVTGFFDISKNPKNFSVDEIKAIIEVKGRIVI